MCVFYDLNCKHIKELFLNPKSMRINERRRKRVREGGRKGRRGEMKEKDGQERRVKKWKERKKLSFAYMQDQKKLGTIRIYLLELFPKNLVLKQIAVV